MSTPEGSLGYLDRLLTYADSPWKIAALAFLAVIAVATVTLWERRAEVAQAILHSTVSPRLEVSQFPKVVPPLMDETGADIAILLSVQLNNNVSRIVAGIKRNDPTWTPRSNPRPVFVGDATTVVRLVEGTTFCFDLPDEAVAETAHEMAALGITRGCMVSIPPVVDVLVGALGIGWKVAPTAQAEVGAKNELRRVAQKLATW